MAQILDPKTLVELHDALPETERRKFVASLSKDAARLLIGERPEAQGSQAERYMKQRYGNNPLLQKEK